MAEEESSAVPTTSPTAAANEPSTLVLGVALGLLGSICINTGNNIQALGLHQLELAEHARRRAAGEPDPPGHVPVEPSKSKVWVFGTVVFVSGSLLNFASYPFAAQSVLACLAALQVWSAPRAAVSRACGRTSLTRAILSAFGRAPRAPSRPSSSRTSCSATLFTTPSSRGG